MAATAVAQISVAVDKPPPKCLKKKKGFLKFVFFPLRIPLYHSIRSDKAIPAPIQSHSSINTLIFFPPSSLSSLSLLSPSWTPSHSVFHSEHPPLCPILPPFAVCFSHPIYPLLGGNATLLSFPALLFNPVFALHDSLSLFEPVCAGLYLASGFFFFLFLLVSKYPHCSTWTHIQHIYCSVWLERKMYVCSLVCFFPVRWQSEPIYSVHSCASTRKP